MRRTLPLGIATFLLLILLITLGSRIGKFDRTGQTLAPSAEYALTGGASSEGSSKAAEPSDNDESPDNQTGNEESSEKEKRESGEKTEEEEISENTDEPKETSENESNPTEDWRLILVNRWNPMPEHYDVELTQLANGHAVDSRVYPDLQRMFDDARAEGLMPTISSSYRTADKQQEILDDKQADYENEGNSPEDAKELAEAWVALPGTSEHQLGIAVDITSADREAQSPDVIWQWLEEHCSEYGFIVRYPQDKSEITGVINEPWHFRYVGQETAKEIMEQGVCLEEYLGKAEH